MATVLLTGASGLLGHEVAAALAGGGDHVVCIGRRKPALDGVDFREMDLSRPLAVSDLPARADAVIHLAQSERFNEFPEAAASVFSVNVACPVALLDWARNAGVQSFVHASSGGLYGSGAKPFVESDPPNIRGRLAYYLSCKYAIEQLADAYQNYFAVAALRYFFVYGARQRSNMLMPRLVASVREGRALGLQGKDGLAINPVHVADAAQAAIEAMRARARGLFNVAGPEVVRIRDIGEILGRHLRCEPVFEVDADIEPPDLVADIGRMKAELCTPQVAPQEGLKELCL